MYVGRAEAFDEVVIAFVLRKDMFCQFDPGRLVKRPGRHGGLVPRPVVPEECRTACATESAADTRRRLVPGQGLAALQYQGFVSAGAEGGVMPRDLAALRAVAGHRIAQFTLYPVAYAAA